MFADLGHFTALSIRVSIYSSSSPPQKQKIRASMKLDCILCIESIIIVLVTSKGEGTK